MTGDCARGDRWLRSKEQATAVGMTLGFGPNDISGNYLGCSDVNENVRGLREPIPSAESTLDRVIPAAAHGLPG